jgi:peptide/nickel transport system substrate-binding protein
MLPIKLFSGAGHRTRRPRLLRRFCAMAAVGAVGLAAAGCGGGGGSGGGGGATSGSQAKTVLRIGEPYTIYGGYYPNIADISSSGISTAMEVSLGYSALFHMQPDGTTVPELASSGEYLNSAKTAYEFTLIHNVKFSDGTPLNAASMVAWMNFYMKQPYGYQALLGAHAQFTAVGQWTVKMSYSDPVQNMSTVLSDVGDYLGTPASEKCIANPKLFTNATCGTGPYVLNAASVVPNSTYTYSPNPYYYNQSAIKFSQVVVKVIPNPATELSALEAGQLDLADIGSDSSTVAAAKSAGMNVLSAAASSYTWDVNEKDPATTALANIKVRQAISYALNRPALCQLIGPGGYATATQLFPNTDVPDPTYSYYTYDPTKAKALLAAAGYGSGLNLTLAYYFARTQDMTMFEGMAQQLSAVGITLKGIDATNPTGETKNAGALLTYLYNATPAEYGIFMKPGAGNGTQFFGTDPTIISLYEQGLHAANPVPAWKQMWQYESQQAYNIHICSLQNIWYESNRVTGAMVTSPRIAAVLISDLSPEK